MKRSERSTKAPSNLKSRIDTMRKNIAAWESDDPFKKRTAFFGCYTVAFVVIAFITLFVYPSNGRSLIWNIDGLEQYYPFFIYEGQWLREIAGGLASGQGLQIPLWSYDLGYGMDIPSTLDTFFDPLNALSALCPERYSEYLFQFLIVFRLYLAGIAFSLFAFRFNTDRFSTLVGALLYSLCGTALAVAFWPAGAWPLVLFPLLLLGVENILSGKRPYIFIFSVTAFFVISYYFSYMACLMLLPYCAVRVIQTQKGINAARFVLWTLRFIGLLAIGILIACFALVPSLVGLFGLERFTSNAVEVPLFYPHTYYTSIASGFVSTASVGSDCYIGFGGLALLACVLLFSHRKENTTLKVAFIAGSIMLLIPAFGSLFNGMNYATNRWVWAYALIVCFVVTRMLPSLLSLNKRTIKILIIATAIYGLVTFLITPMRTEAALAAGIILLATLFVLTQVGSNAYLGKIGILCCLTAGLSMNAFYFISPDEGGIGKQTPPSGYAYTRLTTDAPNRLVSDLHDEGVWRYDGSPSAIERTRNDSLILGLKGIDFYNSSYTSAIDDYHTELALNRTGVNFSYRDLDGRAILESLAGVKYYLGSAASAPLTYLYNNPENMVSSGTIRGVDYQVYEGSNTLPLAYTYDSYIPRQDYLALSPAERQETLLQGVVLDESSLPQTQLTQNSQIVPSSISAGVGASLENNVLHVEKAGATLTLTFEGLPNSETYLYTQGLNYKAISPLEESSHKGEFNKMPWYKKALTFKKDMEWRASSYYTIELTANNTPGVRQIENYTDDSHMYGGKDEWLVNMGYSQEAKTSITLHFNYKGDYKFDDLSIVCQPMEHVSSQLDTLKTNPVENLTLETNKITASVDLENPEALFFSIPYSKGWTATVDGQPASIERANTAFMALELGSGHHEIELHYLTPGLPEGIALSCTGLIAFVVLASFYRFGGNALRSVRATPPRKPSDKERNVK